MREIKFRAWDGEKMIAETTTPFTDINAHIAAFGGTYLMQFTGLKDRNGQEIYEGDIVSILDPGANFPLNWWVEYNADNWQYQAAFLFKWRRDADDDNPSVRQMDLLRGKCEVVGNIYENPELLTNTAYARI